MVNAEKFNIMVRGIEKNRRAIPPCTLYRTVLYSNLDGVKGRK